MSERPDSGVRGRGPGCLRSRVGGRGDVREAIEALVQGMDHRAAGGPLAGFGVGEEQHLRIARTTVLALTAEQNDKSQSFHKVGSYGPRESIPRKAGRPSGERTAR